jgi:hypothetical protein
MLLNGSMSSSPGERCARVTHDLVKRARRSQIPHHRPHVHPCHPSHARCLVDRCPRDDLHRRDRRLRILKRPNRRGPGRRSSAGLRPVHTRPRRTELPRPKRDWRADHPERHQPPVPRVPIRPTSLRQAPGGPPRPGHIVGEPRAAAAHAGQMHALPWGAGLRRPDEHPAAPQQRQRRRRQRLVSRARDRAGAAVPRVSTSRRCMRWRRNTLTAGVE